MVRNPIWRKNTLAVLICMFDRVSPYTNLGKTKTMVCTPEFIWGKQGESAYKRWETGEGATFREGKIKRVSCEECGVTIAALSLRKYMEKPMESP